ncbi:hypothetical protein ACQP2T_61550 [Nonomuraea sp. CA-143628]|uniref:hypothetical protein n=1 Tax=Nonomuraea sp. CA-143628 TaxID=3239997 RepID=UPI003D93742C
MARRLTPTRLAFLTKATNDTTWVYSAFPDVTGHALNPDDVDALVELGLITLDDGIPGQGGHHVNVTDAGFLAVKEYLDARDQAKRDKKGAR